MVNKNYYRLRRCKMPYCLKGLSTEVLRQTPYGQRPYIRCLPQVGFSILSGILMAITLFMPIHTDYLKRFFSYSGAFLWTNLPESLRLSPSLTAFKDKPTPTRQPGRTICYSFLPLLFFIIHCIYF